MKYILSCLFCLTGMLAIGQMRTTKDPRDLEFLYWKLLEIVHQYDSANNEAPFEKHGSDFAVSFRFKAMDSSQVQKTMYSSGYIFAGVFYREALSKFKEFETMTVTSTSKEGKKFSIQYHFVTDSTVGFKNGITGKMELQGYGFGK